MTGCMGGWCRSRAACAHYLARGDEPAERLCPTGQEWPEPVKAAGQCPYCHEPHTLSQCWRWKLAGTPREKTEKCQ